MARYKFGICKLYAESLAVVALSLLMKTFV